MNLTNNNNPPTQLINDFYQLKLQISYNSSITRVDGNQMQTF